MVLSQSYLKLSMVFPKVSLLVPDSLQFMLMIFRESISHGKLHLYADDTTSFVIGDSTDDVVWKLNLLFAEICGWCDSNKFTLHTGKLEVMILQRNTFVGPLLPVQCRNTAIEYTSSTKSSGVVIDNRLL